MRYRSIQDLNGSGHRTGSCREKTLSHDDPKSEVKLWITGNTEIGSVLEVKTFCHFEVHGIEIQIPSTSRDNTNVWVVISRGTNRNVDEFDATIQILLQLALKKLTMEASRKVMQDSR